MSDTPLLPCVSVTLPMLPVVRTAPLGLPVAPAGGQLHPPRPRAWGLSREWQGLTSSQEEPWTLWGGEGEREREREGGRRRREGGKEERGRRSEGNSGMRKGQSVSTKAVCIRKHVRLLLCFLSGKQPLRILSQKLFRFTQECIVLCTELLLGNGHWRITSR